MSHLVKPPPLKPLLANGLIIFRLPEPPLIDYGLWLYVIMALYFWGL